MKYLITGGAGFIGGHLSESLLNDGHEVVIIDNFSTGSINNLKAVANNKSCKIIEADVVEDANLVAREVKKCDAIFHLAAAVGVDLVVKRPVHTIVTNVHGSENIISAASLYKKRIILASTSEVYGKSSKETFSESDDLLIGPSTHSRWGYACSKLLDEFYLMAHYKENQLPGTVVRFFNTVGPRQSGMYGMVVPRFVRQALANDNISVYGTGKQSRCFCHVFDVIKALKLLVHNENSYGKIFNIGSQDNITIENLAKKIISHLNSSSKIEYISYEDAYDSGFEDMFRRMPNTDAIKSLINWQNELSLENIIDDVANSMKSN